MDNLLRPIFQNLKKMVSLLEHTIVLMTRECDDGSTLELKEDIVLIKFCQIDEPSMKFWRGLVRQAGTNGNPFAEP